MRLLIAAAALALASVLGWWRLARRSAVQVPRGSPALAIGGLATIVVALASPLDELAHQRFSAHMLLTAVAAPALLLATL
ncbi:MAG TPA: cytochrome c oxidase assembly protein [Methylomirabilota bacterium]|jgi:cytochrome c oxidase assembly factor CtaG|nr:cytochrome c oxidase assembly protein [Methylomirabilota bacterium]